MDNALEIDQLLARVRALIHRGEFSRVARDAASLEVLESLAAAEDVQNRTCLQASVMLAELYDQMSRYSKSERFLAFDRRGHRALQMLKERTEQECELPSSSLDEDRKEQRLLLRALAFFCLQHAIAWHRETQDAPSSLKSAIQLASAARSHLVRLTGAGFRFDGSLSVFDYWIGRFHLLTRDWTRARDCFRASMQHEQDNLLFHLNQHAEGKHKAHQTSDTSCAKCASRVDYTNYLLASNMAFGLAVIELEEGAVENALILLRAALIMLEGSTKDGYRKGYVRLLIGKAERVRSGANATEMGRAIRVLEEAVSLLTPVGETAAHSYYAANAYHQLSLACIFVARDRRLADEDKEKALVRACGFYLSAKSHHDRELEADRSRRFLDRYLEVRLNLTRGRILSEVLKVSTFKTSGSFREKLRKLGHPLRELDHISEAWNDCLNLKKSIVDDALITRIANELLASIEDASKLDTALSGTTERRAYLRIAQAEAIAVVTRYAVAHSRRTVTESEAAKLVGLQPEQVRGFFQHNGITPKEVHNEAAYVWSEVVLANAIVEMKKLAGSRPKSMKVHATAEVMLARLLLVKGDKLGAGRQLRQGWDVIEDRVENTILHDAVNDVRNELGTATAICTVDLGTEHRPFTWKEMQTRLHKDIIKALREKGLKDEAIAANLVISKGTLRNWETRDETNPGKSTTVKTQAKTDTGDRQQTKQGDKGGMQGGMQDRRK